MQVVQVPVVAAGRPRFKMNLNHILIVIRGAGEMASALAWRLHMARFRVVMTEREQPLAVRRRVSFCEAVWDGMAEIEGVVARLIDNPDRVSSFYVEGELPLLVDPDLICLQALKPEPSRSNFRDLHNQRLWGWSHSKRCPSARETWTQTSRTEMMVLKSFF